MTTNTTSPASTAAITPSTTPGLASITFDCNDALAAATFWAGVLGREPADGASSDYAMLPGSPAWSFMKVPEKKTAKNRVHVDLHVDDDLAGAVDRIVALGATRLGDFDEAGFRWTTLLDPEGNEFDVATSS